MNWSKKGIKTFTWTVIYKQYMYSSLYSIWSFIRPFQTKESSIEILCWLQHALPPVTPHLHPLYLDYKMKNEVMKPVILLELYKKSIKHDCVLIKTIFYAPNTRGWSLTASHQCCDLVKVAIDAEMISVRKAECLMCVYELHPWSAWEWCHYRNNDVLSNSWLFLSHHALISILSLTRRTFGEDSPALISNIVSKLMWDLW